MAGGGGGGLNYGEIIYETSRAFADDEDELDQLPVFQALLEKTSGGVEFLKECKGGGGGLLCVFNGKVALGFAQGFLNNSSSSTKDAAAEGNFDTLGTVTFSGKEGTVDSLLERPRKKQVARILKIKSTGTGSPSYQLLLFVLVDTSGIPRSYSYEIMEQLQEFIEPMKQVVLFHNEPLVLFRGRQGTAPEGQLFHIKNNAYNSTIGGGGGIPGGIKQLPQPNLISGVSAAVLTYCEMIDKPALLLINYTESDRVDSESVKGFRKALLVQTNDQEQEESSSSSSSGDNREEELNFQHYFRPIISQFDIKRASKTNLSHVSESNLFI